jgi:hypothetical protein
MSESCEYSVKTRSLFSPLTGDCDPVPAACAFALEISMALSEIPNSSAVTATRAT